MPMELENLDKTAASTLVEIISEDSRYIDYQKAREDILSDSKVFNKILEYKRLNNIYQQKLRMGENITFDEERQISNVYWFLHLNPKAMLFMAAEQKLAELLHGLFSMAIARFSIDVDFFL